MKIYIARDYAVIPEDLERFLKKHPEKNYEYASLHAFYDKPIWKENKWTCSRIMFEIPTYMFPEIEEGMIAEFELTSLKHEYERI